MTPTAVVMGSGLGGMSAAFQLKQAGFQVRVLEKEGQVGGRTCTLERDGFRIDRAASLFATSYDALSRLIEDAGLSRELVPASELLGIHRGGRNHPLRASSKLDAIRTGALSLRGKPVDDQGDAGSPAPALGPGLVRHREGCGLGH